MSCMENLSINMKTCYGEGSCMLCFVIKEGGEELSFLCSDVYIKVLKKN